MDDKIEYKASKLPYRVVNNEAKKPPHRISTDEVPTGARTLAGTASGVVLGFAMGGPTGAALGGLTGFIIGVASDVEASRDQW